MLKYLAIALLFILPSVSLADGKNGGSEEATVSVTIDNSVICEYFECNIDGIPLEPLVETDEWIIYVY